MGRELTVTHDSFPLARPFRISRGVKTSAEVVTVTLAQGQWVGRGECVPYPHYGETIETVMTAIEAQRASLEAGAGRIQIMQTMPAGAARNAIDCALWDLELRAQGCDIFTALGISRPERIATALTVGLDTPEYMGEATRKLADKPLLKVKVDSSEPAAQIGAVRQAAPAARLIVDPNESWTIAQVRALEPQMAEWGIDLLEQPLPAGEDAALQGYRSRIAIAADESIHTAEDLATLPDGYRVVNIKLDKTGGLTAAMELVKAARMRGLGVMTGCMICSSLSIAPALAVASFSDFVDLDGPFWLARDRHGGVTCDKGYLRWPAPGFWGAALGADPRSGAGDPTSRYP